MKLNVRMMLTAATLFALLTLPGAGVAAQSEAAAPEDSIPITRLIADVAKRTDKIVLIDPRVQADVVLAAADRNRLDYAGLLSVLQVHGFAAVEEDKYVRVVPDANARQLPLPLITGSERYPNAQYVSKLVAVKSIPATQLVPILRPLLPQQAHLVAFACTNVLLIADTFGNVKRIEKLVQALDTASEPYTPAKCGAEPAKGS